MFANAASEASCSADQPGSRQAIYSTLQTDVHGLRSLTSKHLKCWQQAVSVSTTDHVGAGNPYIYEAGV
jgi:hypothetical protein